MANIERLTMFQIGKMYKHERTSDVAFRVTGKSEKDNSIDLFGRWYNLNTGLFIDDDHITIKKDDFTKWNEVS